MALSQVVPEWMQIVLVALFGAWVLHRIALSYLAVRSDRGFWDTLTDKVLPKFLELIETAKVDADAHAKIKDLEKRQMDSGRGLNAAHSNAEKLDTRLVVVEERANHAAEAMAAVLTRLETLEAAEKQREAQGRLPLE